MKLDPIPVAGMDMASNPADIRRDLHAFVQYARSCEIKRSHRGNGIPLSHRQRLAKLIPDSATPTKRREEDYPWIDFLDHLSLALQFVTYDTEGEYQGYSSSEPSFPDNYIEVNEKAYQAFLSLSPQAQEEGILAAQVQQHKDSRNEFFEPGPLSRLDRFDMFGCATGVMPTLKFSSIRRHLLELLAQCPGGAWLSTLSFIEHLRAHEPYFLIPQKPPAGLHTYERARYHNFYEHKKEEYRGEKPISDTDPRGFFKVEGRYMERFLEGIPLNQGYIELAYARQETDDIVPSFGCLKAFRLTDRFFRVMRREVGAPKITVLPNFEVHINSLLYPASVLAKLVPFSEIVTQDVATILRLTRPKVASYMAKEAGADVVAELREVSGAPLPPNVEQELVAWAGHSENFTLYEGFGLLEGDHSLPGVGAFVVEEISNSLAVVRLPDDLYALLERGEHVPIQVEHKPGALAAAPEKTPSLFVAKRAAPAPAPRKLTVRRHVEITLRFPDAETHAAFAKALLDAKHVVATDFAALTIRYPKSLEPQIQETLKALSQRFPIRLQDE